MVACCQVYDLSCLRCYGLSAVVEHKVVFAFKPSLSSLGLYFGHSQHICPQHCWSLGMFAFTAMLPVFVFGCKPDLGNCLHMENLPDLTFRAVELTR